MNIYMTFGTHDFLKMLYNKHRMKHALHLLDEGTSSALLYESEGKTIFQSGKSYEVLASQGEYSGATVLTFQYVPITEDDADPFEFYYKNHTAYIQNAPGCRGYRILRPQKRSDDYLIITIWDSEGDYRRWKDSNAYQKLNKWADHAKMAPQRLFSGHGYEKVYVLYREELQ